jgi:hypothetical protein
VLSRAKAAIEAGENPRIIAEMLACANEHFHTSQRKIGGAVGWDHSKVSRVLKWRRTGYKQSSPFGPTTRAGRASHRKDSNGSGGSARAKKLDDDDGNVSLVGHCSPPNKPALLPAPVKETLPSGSTQTEQLPIAEAATGKTQGPQTQTIPPIEGTVRKRKRSDSRQLKKQKPPARNSKAAQKLSLRRGQIPSSSDWSD